VPARIFLKFNAPLVIVRRSAILRPPEQPAENLGGQFPILFAKARHDSAIGSAGMGLDGVEKAAALGGEAHGVSAAVLHGALALDDTAAEQALNNIGKRRTVYSGQTHKIGLAETFMLRNRCNDGILARSEVEIPCLEREDFRGSLACPMKQMNDGTVDGVGTPVRRPPALSTCVAYAFFCIQHAHPVARLNLDFRLKMNGASGGSTNRAKIN
jgi:hypothetical protein